MLNYLQNHLQNYLLDSNPQILPCLNESEDRLQIYYNAYRLRLIEILESDYPKLLALVGDEAFQEIAINYIEQHPSIFPSVRYFGKFLPEFLRKRYGVREQPPPAGYAGDPLLLEGVKASYMAEMAEFEWGLASTADSADHTPLTVEDLKKISPEDWGNMQFQFHPSLISLSLEWNTSDIWQSKEPLQPTQITPVACLQWRKGINSFYRVLTPAEALAFNEMSNKSSFGAMCESICDLVEEEQVPMLATQFLQQWVHDGLIVSIDLTR